MTEDHTKNARPSSREKHQKGKGRRKRDKGKEKADERRGEFFSGRKAKRKK